MPFDPAQPANNSPLVSQVVRDQLLALFQLIQSIPAGPPGPQGIQGNDGAQGPPFAQAIIDAVNTLNPGDAASISVSFDGTNVHFTFNIPRGNAGAQGAPGEVSNNDLNNAISGTSNNTNAVALLNLNVSDPPTQAELQAVASKLDELILNGRR